MTIADANERRRWARYHAEVKPALRWQDVYPAAEMHGKDDDKRMQCPMHTGAHADYLVRPSLPCGVSLLDFQRTDLGNSERFRAYAGDLVWYCDAYGWLVWNGKRWVPRSPLRVAGVRPGRRAGAVGQDAGLDRGGDRPCRRED